MKDLQALRTIFPIVAFLIWKHVNFTIALVVNSDVEATDLRSL